MLDYLYLFGGLVLLILGGDALVRASVDLALRLKISMLVVGMTVVSFATSAPELLVSLNAGLDGLVDISFGNVIGSNIANISLVLGLTAMVLPISVQSRSVRKDFWFMMGATLLLLMFLLNGLLSFWESLIFIGILVFYNIWQVRSSTQSKSTTEKSKELAPKLLHPALTVVFGLGGIAALHFGSSFLVKGAVNLATQWGISERVIGLTIVSVGTSLPELAASLIASLKGKQDLSLGNILGSNIFNILAVLGITGLIIELPVKSSALLTYDFPWLIGICFLLLLLVRLGRRYVVSRWQGLLLFLGYVLYVLGVFYWS